jgi:hypothetical protein
MRLKKGTLQILSTKSDIDTSKLSAYAATRLRPSRKRALHLEGTTGIPAALWLLGSSEEIKQAIVEVGEVV